MQQVEATLELRDVRISLQRSLFVTKHKLLKLTGLVAPPPVGSFPDLGWNLVPCFGRQILNHWTTREVPESKILKQG